MAIVYGKRGGAYKEVVGYPSVVGSSILGSMARTVFPRLFLGALAGALMFMGCAGSRIETTAGAGDRLTPVEIEGWEVAPTLGRRFSPTDPSARSDWDRGWDALVLGRLAEAHRFSMRLRSVHGATEAGAVLEGFVALRAGQSSRAAEVLDRVAATAATPDWQAAAEAGLVLAAMSENQIEEAFRRLERLGAIEPAHPLVDAYRTTLRLELAEQWVGRAREYGAGDPVAAAAAYAYALEYAGESASLQLEYARASQRAGLLDDAEIAAARAVAMEPESAPALELYADVLSANGSTELAIETYERALTLDPSNPRLEERRRELVSALRVWEPPPPYFEIEKSVKLTREQLAALLYVNLAELLRDATRSPVIVTDVETSWARDYILEVLALGLLNARPNHTFERTSPAKFGDLVAALRRAAVLIADASGSGSKAMHPGLLRAVETLIPDERPHFVSGALAITTLSQLAAWSRPVTQERSLGTSSGRLSSAVTGKRASH